MRGGDITRAEVPCILVSLKEVLVPIPLCPQWSPWANVFRVQGVEFGALGAEPLS